MIDLNPIIERIRVLLNITDQPNREKLIRIFNENIEIFRQSPASQHNHQAYPGGYLVHVEATMRAGFLIQGALSSIGTVPRLSDILIVMFLHDLEKPWKYVENADMPDKQARKAFRYAKIKEYGIELNEDLINGLDYVEGEIENYSNRKRYMGPLAAVCHMADIASARLWP